MRKLILGVLMLAIVSAITPAGVVAQSTNQTGGQGQRIDSDTVLLESRYNASAGEAVLRFRSDGPQAVTISDAGSFSAGSGGGVIDQKTVVLDGGEQTVRMQVNKTQRGRVAVTISTDSVLWAEPIRQQQHTNPFAKTSPTAGWLGGAGTALSMTVLAALKVRREELEEPEQME